MNGGRRERDSVGVVVGTNPKGEQVRGTVTSRRRVAAALNGARTRTLDGVLLVSGLTAILVATTLLRAAPGPDTRPALVIGAGGTDLVTLRSEAADILEAALAKGGTGITFEVVQTSVVTARPGGPRVSIPDPLGRGSIGETDAYHLLSLLEEGVATADGYYAALLTGPAPGDTPDWTGTPELEALVRDGVTYRNDGEGWYPTDNPPGIGLDPASIRLLPRLVRNLASAADAGVDAKNGSLRLVTATTTVTDAPGVIAVDAAAFTRLTGPATLSFDPDGRVVGVRMVAINTRMTNFDLVVTTEITLRYTKSGELPRPEPALPSVAPAGQ